MKAKLHLPYLDGMRGLCALYVVIHHIVIQFITLSDQRSVRYTYAIFKQGHYAVDAFIVISGFCLMIPLIGAQTYKVRSDFFYKRAKRIYMPYLMAMILALVLIATIIGDKSGNYWDSCVPVTFKDIAAHLLLVHDIFKKTIYTINYPFWSISVECRIYLLFPLLLLIWRKWGIMATLGTTMIISVCFWVIAYLGGSSIAITQSGVNPYIILFCLGMIAAELSFNPVRNISKVQLWLVTGFGAAVAGIGLLLKSHDNTYINAEIVDLGLGVLCFCLLLFTQKGYKVTKVLSAKPVVFLGTFAYSIYLIHSIIIEVLWKYALPETISMKARFFSLIFVGTPIILAVAYLFYLACEKPFMNKPKSKVVIQASVSELA